MNWSSYVRRWQAATAVLLALSAVSTAAAADDASARPKTVSGLALPRFVSLKSDRVNLRSGPGTEYPTAWVYRRAGLPLEVIKEFEAWRQVRDSDGAEGWVLQSFLSGRRTALVQPWDVKPDTASPNVAIHRADSESSAAVARVEAGVIANVHECDGRWCHVTVDDFRGYLEQKKLWGIYPSEIVK